MSNNFEGKIIINTGAGSGLGEMTARLLSTFLKINRFILFLLFLFSLPLLGQDSLRSITVKYITDTIKLDGILDEAIWQTADIADNFWQFFPTDSVRAKLPTEVRILYDDHTVYVGIHADRYAESLDN